MASSACGRDNHSYSVFSPQVTVSDSSYLGDCVNKEVRSGITRHGFRWFIRQSFP